VSKPIEYWVTLNQLKKCELPECNKRRRGLSRFCHYHRTKFQRYGDPNGKSYIPSTWNNERSEVIELLALNADHPGITRAIEFLDRWIFGCGRGVGVGHECIDQLHISQVTGRQVLTEITAIYLFSLRNPHRIFTKRYYHRKHHYYYESHLFMLMARKVILMVPGKSQNLKHLTVRHIARHLRKNLGVLIDNVARSIEEKFEDHAELMRSQNIPLRTEDD